MENPSASKFFQKCSSATGVSLLEYALQKWAPTATAFEPLERVQIEGRFGKGVKRDLDLLLLHGGILLIILLLILIDEETAPGEGTFLGLGFSSFFTSSLGFSSFFFSSLGFFSSFLEAAAAATTGMNLASVSQRVTSPRTA
jgi:hypothetical protein